jgi:hypothetical protein
VTSRLTWYSATCPSSTLICCSFTHAEVTPRNDWVARSTPTLMASSKLTVERAEISVTRATSLISFSFIARVSPRLPFTHNRLLPITSRAACRTSIDPTIGTEQGTSTQPTPVACTASGRPVP